MTKGDDNFSVSCPPPKNELTMVKLGHGSGGRLTDQLIDQVFLPFLDSEQLLEKEDAATVSLDKDRIAVTTDSYVVSPIIFPGGNIGSLSVHGTVNDLCMRGAKPLYLSAAFILEEGFDRESLETVVRSMRSACKESGVVLVAADTKVVNKGCADKLFITTTGVGLITQSKIPSASRAKAGDAIILSGDIGRHGMAIMAARHELEFETTIESDSAPLNIMSQNLLSIGDSLHSMRDLTRGGLASVLNEIAVSSAVGIEIDESSVPIDPRVKAACEVLGLDPLYVACEGRLVAIVEAQCAEEAVRIIQESPYGDGAKIVGEIVSDHPERVVLKSVIGGRRIVDKLSGDQLPRIC